MLIYLSGVECIRRDSSFSVHPHKADNRCMNFKPHVIFFSSAKNVSFFLFAACTLALDICVQYHPEKRQGQLRRVCTKTRLLQSEIDVLSTCVLASCMHKVFYIT